MKCLKIGTYQSRVKIKIALQILKNIMHYVSKFRNEWNARGCFDEFSICPCLVQDTNISLFIVVLYKMLH